MFQPLRIHFTLLFTISTLLLSSCTKQKHKANTATGLDTTEVASFFMSEPNGANFASTGDTVSFRGFAAKAAGNIYSSDSGYKFQWDFGDGTSDFFVYAHAILFNNATHLYTTPGDYTIHLLVNDTLVAPGIKLTICKDPVYTSLMCTARTWTGGKKNDPESTDLADSTFAIVYKNKVNVTLWDKTFIYTPAYSSDSILSFAGADNNYIYYNAARDSMGFYYSYMVSSPGHRYSYEIWYHTP